MKGLFGLNSPFSKVMSKVFDLMIVNILFIICSLPVITAGPSLSALCRVCQNLAKDKGNGIISDFFAAFKGNFKQSLIPPLAIIFCSSSLYLYSIMATAYLPDASAAAVKSILYMTILLVFTFGAYLFQLIARYHNTLKQHLSNALRLMILNPLRTIAIIFLLVLPVIFSFISFTILFFMIMVWLLLGFSAVTFAITRLLLPVFDKMEGNVEEDIPCED